MLGGNFLMWCFQIKCEEECGEEDVNDGECEDGVKKFGMFHESDFFLFFINVDVVWCGYVSLSASSSVLVPLAFLMVRSGCFCWVRW